MVFKKLLIANRGEIACRIIRTARQLGIPTVAVYSEADEKSLHADLADEAILIGASAPSQSYLNIESMVKACVEVGADALHPGYGFLSENPEFARAVEAANVNFVGPSAELIELMGDKIASKKLAASAGVPVIPGYAESLIDSEDAIAHAQEIGYPVMLKASAGGGGKGLRIVFNVEECCESFERVRSEALASFGDSRVFIEKYIPQPRHIEIQVIGDKHGNRIHLGERECSIQRRHQKVIEESPSTFVDDSMREAMGIQALALADAVDYFSAGTVEFVADSSGHFYFLEMNTRLQVEHPVTEMTKNVDIVELMLRIANNEQLSLSQKDIKNNGWAIESRIYAEDPYQDFLPETGRLFSYMDPLPSDNLRIDSGVREGDNIDINYDPMLAKVITWGKNRDEAIELMTKSLDYFCIKGVVTNIPLLAQIFRHPLFIGGQVNTDFFREVYPDGFGSKILNPNDQLHLVALAASLDKYESDKRAQSIEKDAVMRHVRLTNSNSVFKTECMSLLNEFVVKVQSKEFRIIIQKYNRQVQVEFTIDRDENVASVERHGGNYNIFFRGIECSLTILSPEIDELNLFMLDTKNEFISDYLFSPMPGLLVSLDVIPAQKIRKGDRLAVVEAMKMENILKAERDTQVSEIFVSQGQALSKGHKMIKFQDD